MLKVAKESVDAIFFSFSVITTENDQANKLFSIQSCMLIDRTQTHWCFSESFSSLSAVYFHFDRHCWQSSPWQLPHHIKWIQTEQFLFVDRFVHSRRILLVALSSSSSSPRPEEEKKDSPLLLLLLLLLLRSRFFSHTWYHQKWFLVIFQIRSSLPVHILSRELSMLNSKQTIPILK